METIRRRERGGESYQVVYKFIARFSGIEFPCHEVSEVQIMVGPDGKPCLAPFTVKAAMLYGKKTLAEVVPKSGVKDTKVEIVQLTHGAEQRVTRVLVYMGCSLVYKMDGLSEDESALMWETVRVTPTDMVVDRGSSGMLLQKWLEGYTEKHREEIEAAAEEEDTDGDTEE